jgi:hypothetical protein
MRTIAAKLIALLPAVAFAFSAAADTKAGRLTDRIAAVVADRAVTYCEVEIEALYEAALRGKWPELKERRVNLHIRESVLDELILKTLAVSEAVKLKIQEVQAQEVERALVAFKYRFKSPEEYVEFLLRTGLLERNLKELLERDLLVQRYLDFRFSYQRMSDAEVLDFYEKNRERYGERPFEEVKVLVRAAYAIEQRSALQKKWLGDAKRSGKIMILENGLNPGPKCSAPKK